MDEELKKLIEKNLELTEEIYKMTKKIKNFINFQKVMSLIYFLIIVIPIILGIIFLPPLLKDIFGQYQSLLGGGLGTGAVDSLLNSGDSINLESLPSSLKNLLKK